MFRVVESRLDRNPVPVSPEPVRARRLLPPTAAFAGSAAVLASLYVAAGAPTPLLVVFEQQWHFPAWVLTVAFASYALGLLAALLTGVVVQFSGHASVIVFTDLAVIMAVGTGVLLGTALNMAGVATGTLPLLWVGGIIGGVGVGASFSGAIRTITPLVQPHQRAGLFASVYLIAYLSFGVPAIIAGLLITPVGLLATVLGYGVAILVTAALGLLAQYRIHTRRSPMEHTPPSRPSASVEQWARK